MPQTFRIGIGRCECRMPYADAIQRAACATITARIESWRRRLPGDLEAVPSELHEPLEVEGVPVTLGTYKAQLGDGSTLVVLQAQVPTWNRPTFLSLGAIGRVYAEGLVVSTDGTVEAAPAELLWEYR